MSKGNYYPVEVFFDALGTLVGRIVLVWVTIAVGSIAGFAPQLLTSWWTLKWTILLAPLVLLFGLYVSLASAFSTVASIPGFLFGLGALGMVVFIFADTEVEALTTLKRAWLLLIFQTVHAACYGLNAFDFGLGTTAWWTLVVVAVELAIFAAFWLPRRLARWRAQARTDNLEH